MRHQEEVECAIDYLRLLDKAIVDVGSLWRVGDSSWSSHLEEPLSYSFVNNDEGVLWKSLLLAAIEAVFLLNDLVKLLKLVADDLSSH